MNLDIKIFDKKLKNTHVFAECTLPPFICQYQIFKK